MSGRHNAFAFAYTFLRQNPAEVISQLQGAGFTGVNIALNYHASRDFLLRQGPQLQYLADGFHYYLPDKSKYPRESALPDSSDSLSDNAMLESLLKAASDKNFEVTAWAVYLHNSALGNKSPELTVQNCFGNHFLSELCPSSPQIGGYLSGLTADLSSRGVKSIAIESLHFHGAHHGEHHERYFVEMSEITAFLFSLCFCRWCLSNFKGDGGALKAKVAQALKPFLDECDSWLGRGLSKEALAGIIGVEILDYLAAREDLITMRYREVVSSASKYGAKSKFIDQAPLISGSECAPLEKSWQLGVDNSALASVVDVFEPLIYRETAGEVGQIGAHYRHGLQSEVTAILRPTYPDNPSAEILFEKVAELRSKQITDIDFYLLDAMRPRDLEWIKKAIS